MFHRISPFKAVAAPRAHLLFDIGRFLKVYRRLFLFVFELRGLEAVEDYGGRGRCGVLDRGAQIAWEKSVGGADIPR